MYILFKPCLVDELDVYDHAIQVHDSRNVGCTTETVHVTDLSRGSEIFATSENEVGARNELLIFYSNCSESPRQFQVCVRVE
jgi:hypothetical protein